MKASIKAVFDVAQAELVVKLMPMNPLRSDIMPEPMFGIIFGTKKGLPVYVEATVLVLPRILINGGRRGFLVGIAPAVLTQALGARAVRCALA